MQGMLVDFSMVTSLSHLIQNPYYSSSHHIITSSDQCLSLNITSNAVGVLCTLKCCNEDFVTHEMASTIARPIMMEQAAWSSL